MSDGSTFWSKIKKLFSRTPVTMDNGRPVAVPKERSGAPEVTSEIEPDAVPDLSQLPRISDLVEPNGLSGSSADSLTKVRRGNMYEEQTKMVMRPQLTRDTAPPLTPRSALAHQTATQMLGDQAFALARQAQWEDCLRILKTARDTPDEGAVVESLMLALNSDDEADLESLPNDFVAMLADVLLLRGERIPAERILSRGSSPPILLKRADLIEDGLTDSPPSEAELKKALELVSLALKKDLDTPGAKDRWNRLRERLGLNRPTQAPTANVTLLTHEEKLPYTLLREVARGGAGVVYEAFEQIGGPQHGGKRSVALKMAHQKAAQRSQLLHEGRIAALFRGHGVMPVLDLDPTRGWLAMPWAPGQSLRERIQQSQLPDSQEILAVHVLSWFMPFIRTLAMIHASGWVHGDIKPANILFSAHNDPLLSDFGLARSMGEDNTPGSQGYVSPERRDGAPCSPQDDVYGIGCVVENMLDALWSQHQERELLLQFIHLCKSSVDTRPLDAQGCIDWLCAHGQRN